MDKKYAHWNGKNPDGQPQVGVPDLIKDFPRNTKTAAKYDVSLDTLSADDLQKQPEKQ